MKNFVRALRKASRHWPSLLLATACSMAVAALWGANIGAFYPILEVTIHGKSMQEWMTEEIQTCQADLVHIDDQLAELEQLPRERFTREKQQDLADLRAKRTGLTSRLAGYQRLEPWVRRFVPSGPFETISCIVLALVVSTLVKHAFLITNEYLVCRVAQDVSRELRMRIFKKALYMDRDGYAFYGTAGFTAQMTHSTNMLSSGLMNAFGAALREPLKMVACLVGAGLICWRLLLLSAVIAPVIGWLLVSLTRRIKTATSAMLNQAGSFHAVMHESLGNVQTVQAFQMEDHESQRFGESTLMMRNFAVKLALYTSFSKPIIEFLGVGMLGFTIIAGAYLVLSKETVLFGLTICDQPLSVSALLVFFGMLIGVSDPLRKLSAVYSSIYTGTIAADTVFQVLDRPNKIGSPWTPDSVPKPHKLLKLDRVDFGYQPAKKVLSEVSLEIPYGSTIGIVGHNGCGKSTLINLLCRYYDPTAGAIMLDDVNIRRLDLRHLRARYAIVNQHTELFNESVSYNIRFGRLEATQAEVEQAARQAHAHEFIVSALASGYETVVGHNGQKLSGGQRQRIALARAILREPEILILDEATSQIDMHSERLIRQSLEQFRGVRTMIIITHREELLSLADQIYEMKDGRLTQMQTHRRLAA
jgi:subfamily B ATP-binding cassette protein MsbA